MRKVLVLAMSIAAAAAVVMVPPAEGASPPIKAQLVKGGLNFPGAFTVAPDGRIFFGERPSGKIKVLDPATGSVSLFYTVSRLATLDERGLLGIALHPSYPTQPYVYAFATRKQEGVERTHILRIRDGGGVASGSKVIWNGATSTGPWHNGGRILFGPDRMLYAVVGDLNDPATSQDLSSSGGKVFRITPTGAVPTDNPFPGSHMFAFGFRNSFGFAFDPLAPEGSLALWETENGPQCNDELNLVTAGGNFAWGPSARCPKNREPVATDTNRDGPQPRLLPKVNIASVIAPTGAVFCTGCGLTGMEGRLLFGTYNYADIRAATLTADRSGVSSTETVLTHSSSAGWPGILSMERGPDGTIYFSDAAGIYKLVQN